MDTNIRYYKLNRRKKVVVTNETSTYFSGFCIEGVKPDDVTVLHSSTTLYPEETNTEIQAVELVFHEEYNQNGSFINDIGLIRLASPIESTYVDFRAKLAMRGGYSPTGTFATVVGWERNPVKKR